MEPTHLVLVLELQHHLPVLLLDVDVEVPAQAPAAVEVGGEEGVHEGHDLVLRHEGDEPVGQLGVLPHHHSMQTHRREESQRRPVCCLCSACIYLTYMYRV